MRGTRAKAERLASIDDEGVVTRPNPGRRHGGGLGSAKKKPPQGVVRVKLNTGRKPTRWWLF